MATEQVGMGNRVPRIMGTQEAVAAGTTGSVLRNALVRNDSLEPRLVARMGAHAAGRAHPPKPAHTGAHLVQREGPLKLQLQRVVGPQLHMLVLSHVLALQPDLLACRQRVQGADA